ncbi:MAG TPA: aldo/keto reductase [Chthoniobacterales bacterium]|jgi:diketogulonate reductase-like aldo/keto reductase|nr:aldo/keto reductase [Chthoniobacterales bacterium]
MKTISLADGTRVPVLGQGTWQMGEKKSARAEEVAALRLGIDLRLTLIDTAEMYAQGGAEEVVADAIAGRRERVFVVSKVYPHHASRSELRKACKRSLGRLRLDAIDLYLLHWPSGDTPIAETVEAFEKLRAAGKIHHWGVSNFDLADMEELFAAPAGANCAANQVLYHLGERGIEFDLLPWCQERQVPIMAYSPIGRGKDLDHDALKKIAQEHDATSAQIALAWVLRQPGVIAIPKASRPAHVRDNAASLEIKLTDQDLADLNEAFPPPRSKVSLAIL